MPEKLIYFAVFCVFGTVNFNSNPERSRKLKKSRKKSKKTIFLINAANMAQRTHLHPYARHSCTAASNMFCIEFNYDESNYKGGLL